jgi:hypothetical protein
VVVWVRLDVFQSVGCLGFVKWDLSFGIGIMSKSNYFGDGYSKFVGKGFCMLLVQFGGYCRFFVSNRINLEMYHSMCIWEYSL